MAKANILPRLTREPLLEPTTAEIAAQERDAISVVMAQRAKFGVGKNLTDQKQATAFGRFVIRERVREELFNAGIQYADIVRRAKTAKGFLSPEWQQGENVDKPTDEQIAANVLARKIEWDNARAELVGVSLSCARACEGLILEDVEPSMYDVDKIKGGLIRLALHFGMLKPFHAVR